MSPRVRRPDRRRWRDRLHRLDWGDVALWLYLAFLVAVSVGLVLLVVLTGGAS